MRCTPSSIRRPNILLAISDDQSWSDAGIWQKNCLKTPAFDRIAKEGVLFTHAYCPASQCSPSRAALLTGRNIWQLEEAGTHASLFPNKFRVYTDILEKAGYHVGYTGKPWAPGNWRDGGWPRNPAGKEYNDCQLQPPTACISKCDYTENFNAFLADRPKDQPFCFWFGCHEPHRNYENESALRAGYSLADITVPPFYPDDDKIRSDLLDYALEVEWFDRHLGNIIEILEKRGELDQTLIVVTSDNGAPFPRVKANLYEMGVRVPLAIRWGQVSSGRVVEDFVSFIDLAPTFLDAAALQPHQQMTGKSLFDILRSDKSGRIEPNRDHVLMGKERHNHARYDNLGYPSRAIRTRNHLYIRNFKPERWPLGDPPYYLCHTKMSNPTKDFILSHRDESGYRKYYSLSYAKRPLEELYDIEKDPYCVSNVANDDAYLGIKRELWKKLKAHLLDQKDPRVLGHGDIFESYPYYQRMQPEIGGFKEYGKYNPKYSRD